MKTIIYYLHNGDKIPFYIGKTINLPKKREKQHQKRLNDTSIVLEVLNEVDDWKYWEKHYINLFKQLGYNLTNKNSGGGGPEYVNELTKQKISQANKGTIHSLESRINTSNKLKGRKLPNDQIEKIRLSKLGKPNSKKGKSDGPKPGVSIAHKGRISPNKGNAIIQYDLQGNIVQEWINMQQAAKHFSINSESIRQCLRGISKKCVGFKWSYK